MIPRSQAFYRYQWIADEKAPSQCAIGSTLAMADPSPSLLGRSTLNGLSHLPTASFQGFLAVLRNLARLNAAGRPD
jgi:hypothetical protein